MQAADLPGDDRSVFEALKRRGNSPAMAMMLLSQQAPGLNGTDTGFSRQRGGLERSLPDRERAEMATAAAKAGFSTAGKHHCSFLGSPSDPGAWVSSASEAKEEAKRRRLNLSGLIETSCEPAPPKPPVRLAPHLVKELTDAKIAGDPETRARIKEKKLKRQDVEAKVIEKHGQKL